MTNFGQVKFVFLLVGLALVVLVDSQDTVQENNTKNVSLHDPTVDDTVKSALENGSVSEVVVRKDLLLFPVNAPNLVVAHTQEIHAKPHINGTNTTDGKPSVAEVAEVNEFSLSQLVSTNDTDNDNETQNESPAITGPALLREPQNVSVLEPGKLLEIVSGFNLSHGLATEKVALPDEVQNISIPKQSIAGLLSKSLQQADTPVTSTLANYDFYAPQVDAAPGYPYDIARRSVDSEDSNSSDYFAELPPYPYAIRKRSIDSDEDHSSATEDNATNNTSIEKRSVDSEIGNDSSIITEETTTVSADYVKRSINEDENNENNSPLTTIEYDSTSTSSTIAVLDNVKMVERSIDLETNDSSDTTEYHYNDQKVDNTFERLDVASTINISTTDSPPIVINDEPLNRMNNIKEKLKEDSNEDMDVAEDIVFRPLFRYRQETRLRQESSARRQSGYRKSYNAYDSDYDDRYNRYKTADADYD